MHLSALRGKNPSADSSNEKLQSSNEQSIISTFISAIRKLCIRLSLFVCPSMSLWAWIAQTIFIIVDEISWNL